MIYNAIDTHYCFYALLCGNHSVKQTGLFMEEKSDVILMGKGESISQVVCLHVQPNSGNCGVASGAWHLISVDLWVFLPETLNYHIW